MLESAMGPKVSVFTTTYNHEPFIAQAIESVLMQVVDFEVEYLIGEDCSTDRTRQIVMDYQARAPDRIRLLLREKNLGGRRNFADTFRACRGEYVAILEGDDFWTSAHKLQRQVDFMEAHADCAICFHAIARQQGTELLMPEEAARRSRKTFYALEDLLEGNFVPTCSTLCRNGLFDDFPQWFYATPTGDWPFHVLNAHHGKIGYIDEVMAVHRTHPGSVWSHKSVAERRKGIIRTLEIFRQNLDPRYEHQLEASLVHWHFKLLNALAHEKNYGELWRRARDLLLRPDVSKTALAKGAIRAVRSVSGSEGEN